VIAAGPLGGETDSVVKMVENLTQRVAELGRTEAAVFLLRMRGMGATREQQAQARQLWDTMEQWTAAERTAEEAARRAREQEMQETRELERAWEQWTNKGIQLTLSMRTPLEKVRDDLAEFVDLFATGAIASETFGRAVDAAIRSAEESLVGRGALAAPRLAPLAELGTAAEYRLRALSSVERDETKPEIRELKEIKATLQQMRDEAVRAAADARAERLHAGLGTY